MIAYTFLVILGIGVGLLALIYGLVEAKWADSQRQFSHSHQLADRVLLCALVFLIAQMYERQWEGFVLVPGMAAWFASIHRITMNMSRRRVRLPFYYLGPLIRGEKESEYDTFWIRLAATSQHTSAFTQERTTVRYEVARKWLPWLYATLFELSILALSTWGYFHFTNT